MAHGELSAVQPKSNINSAINYSPRDARLALDRKVVQTYDASKIKVFLYGAALAKENVYNSMDVIYRDPKGSLNALVAVVNGRALDALNVKQIGQKLHAFHFDAWSRLNWDKDYPNVKITPDIKVNIIQHGIIN